MDTKKPLRYITINLCNPPSLFSLITGLFYVIFHFGLVWSLELELFRFCFIFAFSLFCPLFR